VVPAAARGGIDDGKEERWGEDEWNDDAMEGINVEVAVGESP
jgi:hypothetical protein